jgi:DNA polymerase
MSVFHCDFETFGSENLKSYGAFKYASGEDTEIVLCAICKDNGPVEIWDRYAKDNTAALMLLREACVSGGIIASHNVGFEIAISAYQWQRTFKFKQPALTQWRCTAAMARVAGIPYSLEKAAEFLKLADQKDKVGSALIRIFSIPDSKTGKRRFPTDPGTVTVAGEKLTYPQAWAKFSDYCRKDVEVERGIHSKLKSLELEGFLLDSFQLDLRMNCTGIPINVPAVIEAEKLVDAFNLTAGEEFREITGYNSGQTAKVLAWLKERGYPGDDMRATTVSRILTGEVEDEDGESTGETVQPEWAAMTTEAVKALKLRALLSFAALKKLPTMRGAVCPDNKVRGALLWYGASRTGRHSGKIIQIQNFRRPSIDNTHECYDLIRSGCADPELLELAYGSPLEAIASCIRHFIHPADGQFLDIDLAQIEARVVAWLSGHDELLQSFRDGKDLYKTTASLVFGVPYDKVDKELRFLGKTLALACNYAGGYRAFATMAKNFGTEVPKKKAKEVVKLYRSANKAITGFWSAMQDAAVAAIEAPGTWQVVNDKIRFGCHRKLGYLNMVMELPSGRRLNYPLPEVTTVYKYGKKVVDADGEEDTEWMPIDKWRALNSDGTVREGIWASSEISYHGPITQAMWGRVRTSGGVLVENVSQATAADFLTHGVLNAEKHGYEPCFVVHDQLICNHHPERGNTMEELTSLFCAIPSWAPGFPLEAAGAITPYYTK